MGPISTDLSTMVPLPELDSRHLNAPGRIFMTAPQETSHITCALIWPPNSCRTTFSHDPSRPSISRTSETNGVLVFTDKPGDRSIPRWLWGTSTMLPGGRTLISALRTSSALG